MTETAIAVEKRSYQDLIAAECDSIRDFLLEKNRKYGSSALEPKRIFSQADPVEQLNVRIDDKLSRIATMGAGGVDEDTVLDLIGYLILKRVAGRKVTSASERVVNLQGWGAPRFSMRLHGGDPVLVDHKPAEGAVTFHWVGREEDATMIVEAFNLAMDTLEKR